MILICYLFLLLYVPATPSAYPSASSRPFSSAATAVSAPRNPSRSSTIFYYHLFVDHLPGLCTVSLQRYRIAFVKMSIAVVLFLLGTYASTSSNLASYIAYSNNKYYQFTSRSYRVCLPVILLTTLC